MSRLSGRLHIFARALPKLLLKPWRRKPLQPQRILIAHNLRLGDTLMLTPLLAKLRIQYPNAQIVLTCPKPIVPLYVGRPFNVDTLPYDPCDLTTVSAILCSGSYDLGIIIGDSRYSWLALGAGCRWIVAHVGEVPAWKNWPINENIPYPDTPVVWSDLITKLVSGPSPAPYQPSDWPTPQQTNLPDAHLLAKPYVVLHPGASTSIRYWPDIRWRELAAYIAALGYVPVWSGGSSEESLIRSIDFNAQYPSFAGRLGLGELWHLFAGAKAVVCLDTGTAHLARLIGVPTVALFGPGNATIHGAGSYWSKMPFLPITIADMPCRNQPFIFHHRVSWARRCDRDKTTCLAWHGNHADCMAQISMAMVQNVLRDILVKT